MQLELKKQVCGSPKCKDATGCTWVGQQSLLRMTVVRMVEMICVQLASAMQPNRPRGSKSVATR